MNDSFEEHYRRTVAGQIAGYLAEMLKGKSRGHRACVTDLPRSLMDDVCGRVRRLAPEIESYILTDNPRTPVEIGPTKLIERRNVSDKVLLVFIPSGLKTAAEDSYGEHTFEQISVRPALYELRRHLVGQLRAIFPHLEKILHSPHARRRSIEDVVRYLLAVQGERGDPRSPGRYLYHLGLVPDLALTPEQAEARVDRNSKKVDTLTQPDKPLLAKIDALKLEPDTIQGELFLRLRASEGTDPEVWLPQTLEWGLTFDHWPEADVHLPDEPPTLNFDPLSKFKGLNEEADDFVAYTTTPITASWRLSPPNPDYLSHYVLTLLREEREDEELLSPKRVVANRRSYKLDLKNVDLDDDEGRAVARLEVRAISMEGETLVSDQSDPFWVEKGAEGTITDEAVSRRDPHGEEVRSVAEALLIGALRARAKSSRKVELDVRHDRSGWASSSKAKGAAQDIYRVRLTTNDLFHLKFVPVLRDLERSILDQPANLRAFRLRAPLSTPVLGHQIESEPIDLPGERLTVFVQARTVLFQAIVRATPAAVIEVTDLRPHEALVLDYVRAYRDLLGVSSPEILARLDTVQVQTPDAQALLLAPTHPLRMLWLLQYQRVLGRWTVGILETTSDQMKDAFERSSLDRITSLNMPGFLATGSDQIWINTDNINLFWGIFLPAPVERSREALSVLYRALSIPVGKADVSTIRAEQVAERMAFYLDQHPYVRTLTLNVVNPGDGLLILDTLRLLQERSDHSDLHYELRFFGGGSYDRLGLAFDELMNEADEQRGQDVDDAFLEASPNPLLPKLTFAKHRVAELADAPHRAFDAHMTILFDHFSSNVYTVPLQLSGNSASLYGLLTEFQTEYHSEAGVVVWSRSIQLGPCPGWSQDDAVASLLSEAHAEFLQRIASAIPSAASGEVPAIQLRLSPVDLALIGQVHTNSDWVITIDRNFGIEYFDNPTPLADYRESYLIDYIPEFLSDVGHRLIISTGWLNEIETLLARTLRELNLLSEQLRSLDMLDALRALSGRIALQVLSQPTSVESLIGLGLARLYLAHSGLLEDVVLIPAAAHLDLFGPNAEHTLAMVWFDERNKLCIELLAIRLCRGTFVGDEYTAREEIHWETQQARNYILAQLAPESQAGHLDQVLRNKAWANVLGFYLGRAVRYGFLAPDSLTSLRFRAGLEALRGSEAAVEINRQGFIFNVAGVTKPAENYHGVHMQVIGNDELVNLAGAMPPKAIRGAQQPEPGAISQYEEEKVESVPEVPKPPYDEPAPVAASIERAAPLEIVLGSASDTGRAVVWAPERPHPKRLANQHILIVGKSGSGKTQTIMALVYELWQRNVASLLLDFHGEYCDASSTSFRDAVQARVLDAAQGIPINPMTVPFDPITGQRTDYRNVVYQVTESLADIFGLGDIQKRILKRAIENAYVTTGFSRDPVTWDQPAPAFSTVWEQLRVTEQEERGTARNLVARVEPLFEAEVFRGRDQDFEDLLRQVTIVRLSSLANKELRTAISRFFLQKVYERMLAFGPSERQQLFCVVDEAHKLSHDPTLTDLVKEARKYGVGLILSSQETRDFDRSIFANTGTLIALQLEIEDARIVAENLGLLQQTERAAAIEIILRQRPGQAVVRNNHYQPYTQVQIVPVAKRLKS